MTTKNKTDNATAIFNAIKIAVNLNNVDLRNAAVQDALARFESEHAALVAVAEAAKRIPQWLGRAMAERAFDNCVGSPDGDFKRFENALANLAAIREGGAK